ncbi:hypothetical protein [Bartonella koehlerae]|uniref:Uncharacterized protein n=1 Tax=Bartonella koehlerae C-29 TaxID=1134510 RepID=A0A067W958_9HYPH|nr:hypothetical protein [Bartonella koehlerae]KEC56525.1 hypothetical protein O9A_00019 [Bartonella koehlerae C-29]
MPKKASKNSETDYYATKVAEKVCLSGAKENLLLTEKADYLLEEKAYRSLKGAYHLLHYI